jgi:hypothetical protein
VEAQCVNEVLRFENFDFVDKFTPATTKATIALIKGKGGKSLDFSVF